MNGQSHNNNNNNNSVDEFDIHTPFTIAANQLALLYKNSVHMKKHSYSKGYNDALDNILQFIDSNQNIDSLKPLSDFIKNEKLKNMDNNSNNKNTNNNSNNNNNNNINNTQNNNNNNKNQNSFTSSNSSPFSGGESFKEKETQELNSNTSNLNSNPFQRQNEPRQFQLGNLNINENNNSSSSNNKKNDETNLDIINQSNLTYQQLINTKKRLLENGFNNLSFNSNNNNNNNNNSNSNSIGSTNNFSCNNSINNNNNNNINDNSSNNNNNNNKIVFLPNNNSVHIIPSSSSLSTFQPYTSNLFSTNPQDTLFSFTDEPIFHKRSKTTSSHIDYDII
ncbi:hypothetical protein CYY_000079 [Polysphondylium violaceum]|uniref:Uncharacterized protein n=1 Tax=Polysphondylium violaceum TaxID=133409 RepID=A0A8J4Q5B3_9MYCE|nr:hypothetical protein CYY_000079 [Polysphondylium violaceum]